jgi:hypothetical protein
MGDWREGLPDWYVWICEHTTNKPWTWIVRDAEKAKPIYFLLASLCIGVIIRSIKLKGFWIGFLVGLAIGVFMAHVWKL